MTAMDEKRVERQVEQQVIRIEQDVYVSLKDHFEAVMREQQRAIEQATTEREKAASILRQGLEKQVQSGDEALRGHINEQINQIKIVIDGQTRLVRQAHDASQQAIVKAEQATEKRLDLLNEFRAQASDEQKRFLPVNVYNEKHLALQDKVASIEKNFLERVLVMEKSLSRLYGGILVVGGIGIINLVKLWFVGV